ncbi:MAG: phosphopantetheine-binding protein [Flavobacteriaceae bacterium]|nr:phosphopantetheine-binding protein [Flavobacteriaceae bacterium]
MEDLKLELKKNIIEILNLEDLSIEDFDDNDSLFGDGIGLDSIDALELIVMLDKDYGIRLTDPKEGKKIFESIEVMATYITEHRKK